MAFGLPVVATRVGSLPEIVTHGETGLLLREGDAEELARILELLIQNPWLRAAMGETGRKRFLERFSVSRTAAQLKQVYREALGDAGRRGRK